MMSELKTEVSVCVLGSSSAGNSTLIQHGKTAFLVDCGFSPGYMKKCLRSNGLEIEDLTGVLITHVHSDHVNEWFVKKLIETGIPLYCPPQIELHLQVRYDAVARASHLGLLKPFRDTEMELEDLLIRSFEVPHDSPGGCFGYSIFSEAGGRTNKVSVVTDMGFSTESVVHQFADSDLIVIESNHDVKMLENSGRPVWLKRRIREIGHLSNDQCARSLLDIIDRSETVPQCIMLAHVSQQCNTNMLAIECTQEALAGEGISEISVIQTHRDRPSRILTL